MIIGWLYPEKNAIRQTNLQEFISVIIPVRNERENILFLLDDLNQQEYPANFYEVVIIDDHSDDGTSELIASRMHHYKYPIQFLKLSDPEDGRATKKKAIELGVGKAKGKIILTIDGDCRVSSAWIGSYNRFFYTEKVDFASGMVTFHEEKSLFEAMQAAEFAILTGLGAVTIRLGQPALCNAANMGFTKQAFMEVGGYGDVDHIISGDDVLLLEKFDSRNKKIKFLKHQDAIVKTLPQKKWMDFYHQRKRWSSKWRMHKKPTVAALALFVFFLNFSFLLFVTFALLGEISGKIIIVLLMIKLLPELAFILIIYKFLHKKLNFTVFLLLGIVYPWYTVFFGIIANGGGFKWKGRDFKVQNAK